MKLSAAILSSMLVLAPAAAFADDTADPKALSAVEIAEMGHRVKIAKGLIALGQKDGDPQMIAIGARMLSELKADVVDPSATGADGKPVFYDPRALLAGIGGLKGGKEAAMSVKLAPDYTKPGQTICYWNYKCDLFFCGDYWDCG